ncbi:MAG: phosphotransferase [Clostridia bacterium]
MIKDIEISVQKELVAVCRNFGIQGELTDCSRYTDGHINSTYLAVFENVGEVHKYIVQKFNTVVFKSPEKIMQNTVGVETHLRNKMKQEGADYKRGTLNFLKTNEGSYLYYETDKCWRIYDFVDNSYTCNVIEDKAIFEDAGKNFGLFQKRLSDYPIETLHETIENFHNTPVRYQTFLKAVEADIVGKCESVQKEIEFVKAHEASTNRVIDLHKQGLIPLRVTHNDTKLNNILFDNDTKKGICIIDLDTIMPGLSLYDFGDSIRFGANTAVEDETDLSKVNVSLELFESYAKGFLGECAGALTKAEVENIAFSAILMTLECGIRFLTDHIQGNVYFAVKHDSHNLDRARNQFKLVESMEEHLDEMEKIIEKVYAQAK